MTGQSVKSDGDMPISTRATGKPSLSLQTNYPLYDWGRIRANVQGREQVLIAAQERRNLVSRQLAIEVTAICLELSKQKAISKANDAYLNDLHDLSEKISKIVAEDSGRASELLQVRSRYLQGQSQALQIRSRVNEVAIRLEKLVGDFQTVLCRDLEAGLLKPPRETEIIENLPIHPQILILEAEYRQARANTAQISAIRKPQVNLRAEHSPMASGVTNDYAQTVSINASIPLYDGNTLKSSETAALQRESVSVERIEVAKNQLRSDLREKMLLAEASLQRAEDFVQLLEVNERVRKDFYVQWAALGRRSLFELLAIQLEQLTLRSGYFTALYDGAIAIANISGNIGTLTAKNISEEGAGR
jgi:adhesin transport system outer membrane protein